MNVVNVNPYESPRVPDPQSLQALGESHSIIQLLTEIRDGQQQILQLQRDALTRQRRTMGYSFLFALPLMLVPFISIYFTSRLRAPRVPAPVVAPRTFPAPLPTASLVEQSDQRSDVEGQK